MKKPAKSWLVFLISCLAPTLGYFYLGKYKHFIINLIILSSLVIIYSFFGGRSINFFIASYFIFSLFYIYNVIHPTYLALKERERNVDRFNSLDGMLIASASIIILMTLAKKLARYHPFTIPSYSMAPTIIPHDQILIDKYAYLKDSPKFGDLVVFFYDDKPDVYYIKRLVGLPGMKVSYQNNKLYVDGEILQGETSESLEDHKFIKEKILTEIEEPKKYRLAEEKYKDLSYEIIFEDKPLRNDFDTEEITVPDNKYFVVGDNRPFSMDSRRKGLVKRKNIVGRATFIFMNTNYPEPLSRKKML